MQLGLAPRIASIEDHLPRVAPPVPGELVAVLEEDVSAARRVDTLLRNLGYRVLAFTSPGAGLPLVATHTVDLVIAQHPASPRHAARLLAIARRAVGVRRPGFVIVTDDPGSLSALERQTYDAIVKRPICRVELLAALSRAGLRRSTPRRPVLVH